MLATIEPKSDQLNSDDLIGGPRTIKVRDVSIKVGDEQPVAVYFEGDHDKPFKLCKSMRRVLVMIWGDDAKQYIGHSMTLYRDPDVAFGGLKVGGIRISHMTGIDEPRTLILTATRGNKKPYTVKPLKVEGATPAPATDPAEKWTAAYIAKVAECATPEAIDAFAKTKAAKLEELRAARPELHERIAAAVVSRRASFGSTFEEDFGLEPDSTATGNAPAEAATQAEGDAAPSSELFDEGKPDEDRGEAFTDDPARKAADALIAWAKTAPAPVALSPEQAKHYKALPDELAGEVEDAISARRGEM